MKSLAYSANVTRARSRARAACARVRSARPSIVGRVRFSTGCDERPGAKAGALNFALSQMASDAELLAVVDADYLAEPGFLSHLVGHFDDPRVGFVQTPHDYREFTGRRYLTMCYWEYRFFFATTMVSMNERGATLTVGTMCIVRREALFKAGGWAEWCVTEDSELSIRIHALGYSSVYVNKTYGRGLIPETFAGYKRQRFRWTFGPIQELKEHIRLFLPRPLGIASALSAAQKLHHFNHGLDRLVIGFGLLTLPFMAATAASLLLHGEVVQLPRAAWGASVALLIGGNVLSWLQYRVALRCSFGEAFGAWIAARALAHTIAMASVSALFTRTTSWRRTNKFSTTPSVCRALQSTMPEAVMAIVMLLSAGFGFAKTDLASHVTALLFVGLAVGGAGYLAGPAMAIIAEREIARDLRTPSGRAASPALRRTV